MSNNIGRVVSGFSKRSNSEHYIIEMISPTTGTPYRHQIFVDNTAKKAYHLIDGVDDVQSCDVLSARFDVLRFALYANNAHWLDVDALFNVHKQLRKLER